MSKFAIGPGDPNIPAQRLQYRRWQLEIAQEPDGVVIGPAHLLTIAVATARRRGGPVTLAETIRNPPPMQLQSCRTMNSCMRCAAASVGSIRRQARSGRCRCFPCGHCYVYTGKNRLVVGQVVGRLLTAHQQTQRK